MEPRIAARPLVPLAAAILLGTLCGSALGLPSPGALAVPLLGGFGAVAGLAILAPRGSRPLLLALIAAGACVRAGARERALPRVRERAALSAAGEPLAGTWRRVATASGDERGELEPARSLALVLESGLVAPGEEIAVLPTAEPIRPARGPVPARGRYAERAPELEVLPDEIVRLGRSDQPLAAPLRAIERLREGSIARVHAIEDPLTRGLAAALLFGERSDVGFEVQDLLVRTGTLHLLAVSGLNVVLVAWLLLWPLGDALAGVAGLALRFLRRRPPDWLRPVLRASLVLFYVPLVGGEAPVFRAGIAFALAALAEAAPARAPMDERDTRGHERDARGHERDTRAARRGRTLRRRPDALSLWSLGLALECLLDPSAPASTSVRLSYAATLGLVLGFGPIRRLLAALLPSGGRISDIGRLGRPRPPWLRVPLQRLIDAALAGGASSIAAVLATLPFQWTEFGELSPAGVIATPLLLVPVTALIGLGYAWTLAPALVPERLLDLLARATVELCELVDRAPGTPVPLPERPLALLGLATALALAACARPRAWTVRCAALVFGALLLPWSAAPAALELHALDVGNGTAIALRAPRLGAWIFDAGSRDRSGVARGALAPLLARWDPPEVSVVLSHDDRDHHSALPWLVERYPVRLWAGALPAHLAERLPHGALRVDAGCGKIELLPGDPPAPSIELWRGSEDPGNEGSRCLALTWRSERYLLTGDAEEAGLAALLRAGALDGPARVLLLPHHGSETPLLGRLLGRSRPAEVWISSGAPSSAGRELDRRGIPWRSTARDGPLSLP